MAHQVFFNFDRNVQQLSSIGISMYMSSEDPYRVGEIRKYCKQYSQAIFQFNSRFSANVGYHYLRLNANSTSALDPRISFSISACSQSADRIVFGIQSQTLPLMSYYFRDSTLQYVNRNQNYSNRANGYSPIIYFTRNKMRKV